jgi:hypothetical protein
MILGNEDAEIRTVFIDSSYKTGYCIWMPGTSKRPRCDNFSEIWATSYAMSSSEEPLLPAPEASIVRSVSNILMASVNAHLRGTDTTHATRRLSDDHDDAIEAVWLRGDAVFPKFKLRS